MTQQRRASLAKRDQNFEAAITLLTSTRAGMRTEGQLTKITEIFSANAFLGELSDADKRLVAQAMVLADFQPAEFIAVENHEAKSTHIVLRGTVGVYKEDYNQQSHLRNEVLSAYSVGSRHASDREDPSAGLLMELPASRRASTSIRGSRRASSVHSNSHFALSQQRRRRSSVLGNEVAQKKIIMAASAGLDDLAKKAQAFRNLNLLTLFREEQNVQKEEKRKLGLLKLWGEKLPPPPPDNPAANALNRRMSMKFDTGGNPMDPLAIQSPTAGGDKEGGGETKEREGATATGGFGRRQSMAPADAATAGKLLRRRSSVLPPEQEDTHAGFRRDSVAALGQMGLSLGLQKPTRNAHSIGGKRLTVFETALMGRLRSRVETRRIRYAGVAPGMAGAPRSPSESERGSDSEVGTLRTLSPPRSLSNSEEHSGSEGGGETTRTAPLYEIKVSPQTRQEGLSFLWPAASVDLQSAYGRAVQTVPSSVKQTARIYLGFLSAVVALSVSAKSQEARGEGDENPVEVAMAITQAEMYANVQRKEPPKTAKRRVSVIAPGEDAPAASAVPPLPLAGGNNQQSKSFSRSLTGSMCVFPPPPSGVPLARSLASSRPGSMISGFAGAAPSDLEGEVGGVVGGCVQASSRRSSMAAESVKSRGAGGGPAGTAKANKKGPGGGGGGGNSNAVDEWGDDVTKQNMRSGVYSRLLSKVTVAVLTPAAIHALLISDEFSDPEDPYTKAQFIRQHFPKFAKAPAGRLRFYAQFLQAVRIPRGEVIETTEGKAAVVDGPSILGSQGKGSFMIVSKGAVELQRRVPDDMDDGRDPLAVSSMPTPVFAQAAKGTWLGLRYLFTNAFENLAIKESKGSSAEKTEKEDPLSTPSAFFDPLRKAKNATEERNRRLFGYTAVASSQHVIVYELSARNLKRHFVKQYQDLLKAQYVSSLKGYAEKYAEFLNTKADVTDAAGQKKSEQVAALTEALWKGMFLEDDQSYSKFNSAGKAGLPQSVAPPPSLITSQSLVPHGIAQFISHSNMSCLRRHNEVWHQMDRLVEERVFGNSPPPTKPLEQPLDRYLRENFELGTRPKSFAKTNLRLKAKAERAQTAAALGGRNTPGGSQHGSGMGGLAYGEGLGGNRDEAGMPLQDLQGVGGDFLEEPTERPEVEVETDRGGQAGGARIHIQSGMRETKGAGILHGMKPRLPTADQSVVSSRQAPDGLAQGPEQRSTCDVGEPPVSPPGVTPDCLTLVSRLRSTQPAPSRSFDAEPLAACENNPMMGLQQTRSLTFLSERRLDTVGFERGDGEVDQRELREYVWVHRNIFSCPSPLMSSALSSGQIGNGSIIAFNQEYGAIEHALSPFHDVRLIGRIHKDQNNTTSTSGVQSGVIDVVRRQLAESATSRRTEVDPDFPFIRMDRETLGKLWERLSGQALKRSPGGSECIYKWVSPSAAFNMSSGDIIHLQGGGAGSSAACGDTDACGLDNEADMVKRYTRMFEQYGFRPFPFPPFSGPHTSEQELEEEEGGGGKSAGGALEGGGGMSPEVVTLEPPKEGENPENRVAPMRKAIDILLKHTLQPPPSAQHQEERQTGGLSQSALSERFMQHSAFEGQGMPGQSNAVGIPIKLPEGPKCHPGSLDPLGEVLMDADLTRPRTTQVSLFTGTPLSPKAVATLEKQAQHLRVYPPPSPSQQGPQFRLNSPSGSPKKPQRAVTAAGGLVRPKPQDRLLPPPSARTLESPSLSPTARGSPDSPDVASDGVQFDGLSVSPSSPPSPLPAARATAEAGCGSIRVDMSVSQGPFASNSSSSSSSGNQTGLKENRSSDTHQGSGSLHVPVEGKSSSPSRHKSRRQSEEGDGPTEGHTQSPREQEEKGRDKRRKGSDQGVLKPSLRELVEEAGGSLGSRGELKRLVVTDELRESLGRACTRRKDGEYVMSDRALKRDLLYVLVLRKVLMNSFGSLVRAFDALDVGRSRSFTVQSLGQALKTVGLSKDRKGRPLAARLFPILDLHGDGRLELDELIAVVDGFFAFWLECSANDARHQEGDGDSKLSGKKKRVDASHSRIDSDPEKPSFIGLSESEDSDEGHSNSLRRKKLTWSQQDKSRSREGGTSPSRLSSVGSSSSLNESTSEGEDRDVHGSGEMSLDGGPPSDVSFKGFTSPRNKTPASSPEKVLSPLGVDLRWMLPGDTVSIQSQAEKIEACGGIQQLLVLAAAEAERRAAGKEGKTRRLGGKKGGKRAGDAGRSNETVMGGFKMLARSASRTLRRVSDALKKVGGSSETVGVLSASPPSSSSIPTGGVFPPEWLEYTRVMTALYPQGGVEGGQGETEDEGWEGSPEPQRNVPFRRLDALHPKAATPFRSNNPKMLLEEEAERRRREGGNPDLSKDPTFTVSPFPSTLPYKPSPLEESSNMRAAPRGFSAADEKRDWQVRRQDAQQALGIVKDKSSGARPATSFSQEGSSAEGTFIPAASNKAGRGKPTHFLIPGPARRALRAADRLSEARGETAAAVVDLFRTPGSPYEDMQKELALRDLVPLRRVQSEMPPPKTVVSYPFLTSDQYSPDLPARLAAEMPPPKTTAKESVEGTLLSGAPSRFTGDNAAKQTRTSTVKKVMQEGAAPLGSSHRAPFMSLSSLARKQAQTGLQLPLEGSYVVPPSDLEQTCSRGWTGPSRRSGFNKGLNWRPPSTEENIDRVAFLVSTGKLQETASRPGVPVHNLCRHGSRKKGRNGRVA
uniref:Cyclic nucleotide-binding domain-containing protein n=1 Tax=Chromera velia CCMP2878 TaxID=1169474 RepID=A0A0G4FDA0_9ALVE|eukprot:Cvel_3222.t1-p1 / transcript=Cvel_3222.t1 / gene=Cvel_3222 / organism=Chromera_velia_CCMP2878 / gene_product=hypothetical protein / transcript_product=hypothetical protein / location=Cvel_scaffold126:21267-32924(-) / protein_length=2705 / sequence_SO=supercontig / SO=protein_coding / is_pseudo=false